MDNLTTSFYVTGGTLKRNAPSYVQRQADLDLYNGLTAGRFCYVLTSRQMGKSSLMVRTATKLREESVAVVVLDLTAIGQNVTVEQWYDGLLTRVGQQLHLEDELEEFWFENERLGAMQRWMQAIRKVVLPRCTGRVVIFIDEIDAVRSLPFSTDEFFAGIREVYNRRSEDADLNRLTFCLLGVATPSDLIKDVRTTPFNMGQRIELTDFSVGEAAPLAQGFGHSNGFGLALLERILYWTGGHPYLTQRLCLAVAQAGDVNRVSDVDRICESLFLSARARETDDNLLFVRERILRSEADRATLLDLYQHVRTRKKRILDDEKNPNVSILRLSGVARVTDGYLRVRNRIYYRVFDREWIIANMPDAELRRQRAAYRKGLVRAAVIAAGIIAVMGVLSVYAFTQKREADRQRDRAEGNAKKLEVALVEATRQEQIANERGAEASKQASRAEEQKQIADDKSKQALEQKKAAEQQRAEAEKQKQIAQRNLAIATTQKRVAQESQRTTQRLFYSARMNLAEQLWERGSTERVAKLLEEDLQSDRRGFEWYHLWDQVHSYMKDWQFESSVGSVAVSPEGRMIAAASDNETRLFSAVGGNLIRTIYSEQGRARSIAFSPDGRILAVAGDRPEMSLWDVATGRRVYLLTGHKQGIWSVAFSPDGKILATASDDRTVKLWSVETGQELAMLIAHKAAVLTLAFSPDGRQLATGSRDKSLLVWDSTMGQGPTAIRDFDGAVTSVAFSLAGGRLAAVSEDKTLRVWSVKDFEHPLVTKEVDEALTDVVFSPDGKVLASGGSDNIVKLWTINDGTSRNVRGSQEVPSLEEENKVHASNFSPLTLGAFLTSRPKERRLLQPIGEIRGHAGPILGLAFSPDGKKLLTGSLDRTAKLWDIQKANNSVIAEDVSIRSIAFSSNSEMVGMLLDERLLLYNSVTNSFEQKDFGPITGFAFSPKHVALIAAGSPEGKVRLISTDKKLPNAINGIIEAHEGNVRLLAFSPDGKTLITAGDDATVRLWDVASRSLITHLSLSEGEVNCFNFSPDGGTLAVGTTTGNLYAWVTSGRGNKQLDLIGKFGQSIHALAFSPNSGLLAVAPNDNSVRIIDVASRQTKSLIEWHSLPVVSLAFSPDGKRLATGSEDKTVRLWDTSTWQELAIHRDHAGPVFAVSFSPDNQKLVSSGDDGARLWRAPRQIDERQALDRFGFRFMEGVK